MLNVKSITRRGLGIIGIISLASAAISACGNSEDNKSTTASSVDAITQAQIPADGTVSASGLVTKNYETGALPSDPYRGVDTRLNTYAQDIYIAQCMIDKGLAAPPVEEFDWNAPTNAAQQGGWHQRLTVAQAQQYGYHLAPVADKQFLDAREAFFAAQTTDYNADYESCMEASAADPLFTALNSVDSSGNSLTLAGDASKSNNPLLVDAMKKWTACMAPLGIPDLPTDAPNTAESVLEKFGLAGGDNLSATDLSTISQDEINMAVQEAQCNEDSQYDQIAYGLTWVWDESVLAENASEYAALLEQIQTREKELKDYITAHKDQV